VYSQFNHDPGIAACPNGDLIAVWYSTTEESCTCLAIAGSRLRRGQSEWEPASVFWNVPGRNDHAPALWYDEQTGRIYHFNGLSIGAGYENMAAVMRTSADNGVTWTSARLIIPDYGQGHMPSESIIRTSGDALLLPCDATHHNGGGSVMWISQDQGRTWYNPGGWMAGIHVGVAELADGRLLSYGRCDDIGGMSPKNISSNLGASWSHSASIFPSICLHGGKRSVLVRLREGPLFYGSIIDYPATIAGQYRTGIFGAVSYNDGETWPDMRWIGDETFGYLSVDQAPNGVIHLVSSLMHYELNLAWLKGLPEPGPPAADLDDSETVDCADAGLFLGSWLCDATAGQCGREDMNYDGLVNFKDFAVMAGACSCSP
jgi:hypothetical protein